MIIEIRRVEFIKSLETTWESLSGKKSEGIAGTVGIHYVDEHNIAVSAVSNDLNTSVHVSVPTVSQLKGEFVSFRFSAKPVKAALEYDWRNDSIKIKVNSKSISFLSSGKIISRQGLFEASWCNDKLVESSGYSLGSLSTEDVKTLVLVDCFASTSHLQPQLQGVHIVSDNDYIRAVATNGFTSGYSWIKRSEPPQRKGHFFIHSDFLTTIDKIVRKMDVSSPIQILENPDLNRMFCTIDSVTVQSLCISDSIRDKFPLNMFFKMFSEIDKSCGISIAVTDMSDAIGAIVTSGVYEQLTIVYKSETDLLFMEAVSDSSESVLPMRTAYLNPSSVDLIATLTPSYIKTVSAIMERVDSDSITIWQGEQSGFIYIMSDKGNFICAIAKIADSYRKERK